MSTNKTERSQGSESSLVEEDQRGRGRGEIHESQDTITLENVPIITPNGDEVASDLTFQVHLLS